MSENFHRNYSAADIEKYWKGQLSPAEMHALEKAAMDDPFLADAIEGYRNSQTAAIDAASLRERLHRRITPARNMQWMKIAASIILVAGVAYASYMLSTKDAHSPVSQAEQEVRQSEVATDSTRPSATEVENAGEGNQLSDTGRRSLPAKTSVPGTDTAFAQTQSDYYLNIDRDRAKVADVQANTQATTIPPVSVFKDSAVASINESTAFEDKEQNNVAANKPSAGISDKGKSRKAENYSGLLINNRFFGRVVDANNQPIPFANVTNTRDNVGTYTNMNGDFSLISADSALDLRIKSVGYEPKNYRFQPKQNQAVVVLADDPFTRDDVAKQNVSRLKLNQRQQMDSLEADEEIEEVAPEVGWNYYNRYIANNIKLPVTREANPAQDVQLSFQVDKNGNPTNIKITRSSKCKECDQAAIQVLKDGPKWKRTTKRSRTTVTISVE